MLSLPNSLKPGLALLCFCCLLPFMGKAQFADLTTLNPSTQQTNYDPGDLVYFSATFANIGSVPSGPATIRYYLTQNANQTIGAQSITPNGMLPTLAPGASTTRNGSVALSTSLPPGVWYIVFAPNSPTSFTEANLANNVASASFTVNAQPDLYPTNPNMPSSAPQGSSFPITTTVVNQGTVAAQATTVLTYWLSTDQSFDPNQDALIGNALVPPIAAQGSTQVSGTVSIPSNYACGNQIFLLIRADGNDQYNEPIESNNIYPSIFTVNCPQPDYLLDSAWVDPVVTYPGDNFRVYGRVTNQGAPTSLPSSTKFWLSRDTLLQTNLDTLVDTENTFGLGTNTLNQESAWFFLPNNIDCGTWYMIAVVDADNDLSETDENNNTWHVPFEIIGNSNPVITNLAPSLCSNSSPLALSAIPSGGSFSGNGVSNNNFSPAQAVVGQQIIQYVHTIQATGCSDTATQSLSVLGSSFSSQTINLPTGQAYTLPGGLVVTSPGIYADTLIGSNGCDSIITTQLTYSPSSCSYHVPDLQISCGNLLNNTFCVPIYATDSVPDGVAGFDFSLNYDPNIMQPTGNAYVGPVGNSATIATFNDVLNSQVHGILYFTTLDSLSGIGEIGCVEFQLQPGYQPGTIVPITIANALSGTDTVCVTPGNFQLISDSTLHAKVLFWGNPSKPLVYDSLNSSAHLPTNIQGSSTNCIGSGPTLRPDLNGDFSFPMSLGNHLQLARDIPNTSSTGLAPAVNSFDALQILRIALFNSSAFTPNPYQVIAADVNLDGIISAVDVTLLQQRIVQLIPEFPQPSNSPSLDWRFVDDWLLAQDPAYTISANYPLPDGSGYHKGQAPSPDDCLPIRGNTTGNCTQIDSTTFHAILLGDLTNSWDINMAGNMKTNQGDSVVIDLSQAISGVDSCEYLIPVFLPGTDTLFSLDLNLDFNNNLIDFLGAEAGGSANLHLIASNVVQGDQVLISDIISDVNGLPLQGNPAIYLKILMKDGPITDSDLYNLSAFIGPNAANVTSIGSFSDPNCQTVSRDVPVQPISKLYPNPFSESFRVELFPGVSVINTEVAIYDMQGKRVWEQKDIQQETFEIRPTLPAGQYLLRLHSADFTESLRITKFD